jgi:hypothetical protein
LNPTTTTASDGFMGGNMMYIMMMWAILMSMMLLFWPNQNKKVNDKINKSPRSDQDHDSNHRRRFEPPSPDVE